MTVLIKLFKRFPSICP